MEASLVSILVQIPFVAAFIWYSLEMNKRSNQTQKEFIDALDKRDEAFDKRNAAVITTINNMNESICTQLKSIQHQNEEHDRFIRENTRARRSTAK